MLSSSSIEEFGVGSSLNFFFEFDRYHDKNIVNNNWRSVEWNAPIQAWHCMRGSCLVDFMHDLGTYLFS